MMINWSVSFEKHHRHEALPKRSVLSLAASVLFMLPLVREICLWTRRGSNHFYLRNIVPILPTPAVVILA